MGNIYTFINYFIRYLIYKEQDENNDQLNIEEAEVQAVVETQTIEEALEGNEGEEKKQSKNHIRNQFNYSERAAQTVNFPARVALHLTEG